MVSHSLHNFDYLPIVQPFYSLRESRPTGGMRSLEFITAPMAGTIDGVNEAGLCITYNYAFTIDRPDRPAGMISMVISEALARCRTVSEAADWITSRPRWGGGLLMLADPSGDIASLELSSTRSKLRRPEGDTDMIYHTNCFGAGEMCEVQVPATAVFTDRVPTPLRGRRVFNRPIAAASNSSDYFRPAPSSIPRSSARFSATTAPRANPATTRSACTVLTGPRPRRCNYLPRAAA